MNRCRVAALALVGWYLLVPPQAGNHGHPDKVVALAQWEQMGTYNSAEDCNDYRASIMKRDQKEYSLSLGSNPPQSALLKEAAHKVALRSSAAICIDAGDPRL